MSKKPPNKPGPGEPEPAGDDDFGERLSDVVNETLARGHLVETHRAMPKSWKQPPRRMGKARKKPPPPEGSEPEKPKPKPPPKRKPLPPQGTPGRIVTYKRPRCRDCFGTNLHTDRSTTFPDGVIWRHTFCRDCGATFILQLV